MIKKSVLISVIIVIVLGIGGYYYFFVMGDAQLSPISSGLEGLENDLTKNGYQVLATGEEAKYLALNVLRDQRKSADSANVRNIDNKIAFVKRTDFNSIALAEDGKGEVFMAGIEFGGRCNVGASGGCAPQQAGCIKFQWNPILNPLRIYHECRTFLGQCTCVPILFEMSN